MRAARRKLKAKGWTRDLYVFVVTNVPDDHGRMNTFEMLRALGIADRMPEIAKKKADEKEPAGAKALRRLELEGMNIHVCTLCASGPQYIPPEAHASGGIGPMGLPAVSISEPQWKTVYQDIYVHSKLMLVDDIFFTLGSANVNVRSMEVDSELNLAMPSPELTEQWRRHLWRIHTGREALDDPKNEFKVWGELLSDNSRRQKQGHPLPAPLIEFYDDSASGKSTD